MKKALNTELKIIGKKEDSNYISINYFRDSVLEELKTITRSTSIHNRNWWTKNIYHLRCHRLKIT